MKGLLVVCFVFLSSSLIFSNPYDYSADSQDFEPIKNLVESTIVNWINDPVLIDVIKKSNSENKNRSEDKIIEDDNLWRSGDKNFQDKYLNNSASDFLREKKAASDNLYAEIFVMDFQGCNVAQSDITSDFWQGDEGKFVKSYNNGNGSVFIDEIEYDESSDTYTVQVSLPIVDPSTNSVVGAITIGVDMSKL